MSEEQLWDPGQEWIQIFDNLLKHPQEWKLCFVLTRTSGLALVNGHQDISSFDISGFDISDFQGVKKGCDCDMCKQRSPSSGNGE